MGFLTVSLTADATSTLTRMDSPTPTCARHPEVETRLRCSSCDTPICPACGREAAVGFKCPDCAAPLDDATTPRVSGRGQQRERAPAAAPGERLPTALGVRATLIGLAAAVAGGAILGPVLTGGAFFLITSGLIGWAVARSVYWATSERNSPYVRAIGLTLAGFSVAIALAFANAWTAGGGQDIVLLAYPAAVYGGWIVVRQR